MGTPASPAEAGGGKQSMLALTESWIVDNLEGSFNEETSAGEVAQGTVALAAIGDTLVGESRSEDAKQRVSASLLGLHSEGLQSK